MQKSDVLAAGAQTASPYIIEVKNVSKQFNDGKFALNDVSLSIKKGEFVTILGPSGCGKTTLLRCIAGFQVATSGDILLNGEDVTQTPPHKRPVNTVFQKYALFPHLNVFDNIAFGLKLKKMPQDAIEKKVRGALKTVGLTDYEERNVDSLSGGQQQRVAIARAIVNEPEVLLLDEPLAALDLKMRHDMQIELKQMHKQLGITFIYVTHDQEEALTLSDRIVVMKEGRIQQIGSPTDIYNEPQNCFVADFIGESNILSGFMAKDRLVRIKGKEIPCIDEGFAADEPVDVVIRPEDIYFEKDPAKVQWTGEVLTCIFKGVHYEMRIQTEDGFEFLVQDYDEYLPGTKVGMRVPPEDIQIMKKETLFNTFEGVVGKNGTVEFLDATWDLPEGTVLPEVGTEVKVEVEFKDILLLDHEEDGTIAGEVHFILFKGDHYHLTVRTDEGYDIDVNTTEEWDEYDRVGIKINPENIRVR